MDLLKYTSDNIISKLRDLHKSQSKNLKYPSSGKVQTAIYDIDKKYIYGTIKAHDELNDSIFSDKLHVVSKISPYYLGAAYLLAIKDINYSAMTSLRDKILIFMLIAGVVFIIMGYYLGRLFVAPMRESMLQMNRFIQDTTHEMNTPLSTILTNIELIEIFGGCKRNKDELDRIGIASKTLSHIYNDLAYLSLNHKRHRDISNINISKLLRERVGYFSSMMQAKMIHVKIDIADDIFLTIDRNDMTRLMDNLISNAIKYNRQQGNIGIVLTGMGINIIDDGVGINKKEISTITDRFKRANSSEGGFGVGLNIVQRIVEYYAFTISIDSILNEGTNVSITWKR